ncbi:MAG: RNA polymerase sigma-70 factor (ECF subfamily) [Limisphaerales bacterium]|jgi:RNA polymerase sigma factor (sigma-70 family)
MAPSMSGAAMPVVDSENSEIAAPAPETLEALFVALEGPLLGYAQRLVRDTEAAQDLVQEAFMKLHVKFDEVKLPKSWLFRTVHNRALNHIRDGRKIVPLEFSDDSGEERQLVDGKALPDEYIERMETIGQARLSLEALDERSAQLIRMKFNDELSYKQMAAETGLSVGNVGYILHHALKRLATELETSGVSV